MLINITGGHDLTLHEVAEAARIIQEAVDPDANIISGMVIDPTLDDAMKVTVIATGFDRVEGLRSRATMSLGAHRPMAVPPQNLSSFAPTFVPAPSLAAAPIFEKPEPEPELDVPFYRKVIAQGRGEDPGGFGPNWSNVDDYDIPTVLRKQMD